MIRKLARLWIVVAIILSVGSGMVGGVVLDRQVLTNFIPKDTIPTDAVENFRLMAQAWNTIEGRYVDRSAVQADTLTYGAISGMVGALGDTGHSRFLTPAMVQEESDFNQGQFEGIGAEVEEKDGHVVIVAPIDGSPAQRAGLRQGEVILKVNGRDVTGLPLEQVVGSILGPAGTTVTVTVQDPATGQTRDVPIVRDRIQLHPVTWAFLPDTTIAHVRVSAFSQGAADDLKQALNDALQRKATGVILDLRNDPGGLLDEAVGAASQFLKNGNVLEEQDAQGHVTPVPVKPGGVALDVPMVVLVNQGTASAAEIVAAALQDGHRAVLMGETTFGTGTVLNQFGLADHSALLLATEEWLTPSGHALWHHGVSPDVEVPLPSAASPLTPETERAMTLAQVEASNDAPLLRAMSSLERAVKS